MKARMLLAALLCLNMTANAMIPTLRIKSSKKLPTGEFQVTCTSGFTEKVSSSDMAIGHACPNLSLGNVKPETLRPGQYISSNSTYKPQEISPQYSNGKFIGIVLKLQGSLVELRCSEGMCKGVHEFKGQVATPVRLSVVSEKKYWFKVGFGPADYMVGM